MTSSNIFAAGRLVKGGAQLRVAPQNEPRISQEIVPWAAAAGIFDNGARWMARIYVDKYLWEQSFHPTYTAALAWIGCKKNELASVVGDE